MNHEELSREIEGWITGGVQWLSCDAPAGVASAVYAGGSAWSCEMAADALAAIADGEIDLFSSDVERSVDDWVDSTTEIYNRPLREWFVDDGWSWLQDLERDLQCSCGDAGIFKNIHQTLMYAQSYALRHIGSGVVAAVQSWALNIADNERRRQRREVER